MEDVLKKLPEAYREDIEKAILIAKEFGCTEVYLFGSLARGEAREESDIDIAVRGCPPEKFYEMYGALLFAVKHEVDIIDFDESKRFSRRLQIVDTVVRIA